MQEVYLQHFELALWSLIVGMFLCAVYDVFRLFRLRRAQNAILFFVNDFVFCLICAVSMCVLFFNLSYGRIRAYAFAFALIGFLIWRVTVSRFVMAIMNRIVNMVFGFFKLTKMRVYVIVKNVSRRIYTKRYCNRAVASVKKLKEVERKEQEYGGKETGSC